MQIKKIKKRMASLNLEDDYTDLDELSHFNIKDDRISKLIIMSLKRPQVFTYIAKFDSKKRKKYGKQEFNLHITDWSRKKASHRRHRSYRLI